MTRIAQSEVAGQINELLTRVQAGERVLIAKGKSQVAALVPVEDLIILNQLQEIAEDWADAKAYRRTKKKIGKPKPFDEFCKEQGL